MSPASVSLTWSRLITIARTPRPGLISTLALPRPISPSPGLVSSLTWSRLLTISRTPSPYLSLTWFRLLTVSRTVTLNHSLKHTFTFLVSGNRPLPLPVSPEHRPLPLPPSTGLCRLDAALLHLQSHVYNSVSFVLFLSHSHPHIFYQQ